MLGVLLFELLNPTGSINKLLFPGKKGMAGRTNFYADLIVYGSELKLTATGTFGCYFLVFGVDVRFHGLQCLQKTITVGTTYFSRVNIISYLSGTFF